MDLCQLHQCNISTWIHHMNELYPHPASSEARTFVAFYWWGFKIAKITWFTKITSNLWLRYSVSAFKAQAFPLLLAINIYKDITFLSILLFLHSPLRWTLFLLPARKKARQVVMTTSPFPAGTLQTEGGAWPLFPSLFIPRLPLEDHGKSRSGTAVEASGSKRSFHFPGSLRSSKATTAGPLLANLWARLPGTSTSPR